MMLMKQRIIIGVLLAFALFSCWAPDGMREEVPFLKPELNELTLAGDNMDGSPVRDTITLSSNRSWNASLTSGEDWLELETLEDLNLEERTKNVRIALKASDNRGRRRSASILFSASGLSETVEVIQNSRTPRLDVKEKNDYGSVGPDAAVYPLTIVSNMAWTAEVAASSAEYAGLDRNSGEGNGTVNISLAENGDAVNSRTAEVVFKAEGCEDVIVTFVQSRGVPYFRFVAESAVADAYPASLSYTISFRTNSNWSAAIEGIDGFSSARLGADSGTREDSSVKVYFTPATCFGKTASLKVKFTPEGGESKVFEVRQEPAIGIVLFDPETGAAVEEACWPFSYPSRADIPSTSQKNDNDPYYQKLKDLELLSGYKAGLYSSAGLWYTPSSGLNFGGKPAGSYLTAPAVEGHRLVKVHYRCAKAWPKNLSLSVCGKDKETPVGGGGQIPLPTKVQEYTWELSGTDAGTEYYLVSSGTANFFMAEVIFYYE